AGGAASYIGSRSPHPSVSSSEGLMLPTYTGGYVKAEKYPKGREIVISKHYYAGTFYYMFCKRKWQSTPVFLLAESNGQREPGRLQSIESQKQSRLSTQSHIHLQIPLFRGTGPCRKMTCSSSSASTSWINPSWKPGPMTWINPENYAERLPRKDLVSLWDLRAQRKARMTIQISCCDEHWGARVSFRSGFLSVYAQKWDSWVIWQFYFQFFKKSPHCFPYIYFCFIDTKAFDCVDHNKLWKILKEMGIPNHHKERCFCLISLQLIKKKKKKKRISWHQGSLACCDPWGCKKSDMIERDSGHPHPAPGAGKMTCFFDVIFNKGNVCIFQSHELRHLSLALDNGSVTGMASGGASTEMRVLSQPNRCALLESARVPGHLVIFDRRGKITNESPAGYADLSKEFVVFVKGVLLNSAVVLLATSLCQALCLLPDGSCTGVGKPSEKSYWRVHKISSGICMFESVKNARMFLRIKDGRCDGAGIGDSDCHFKIKKNLENACVSLESVKSPGLFVGLQSDGQAKPVVYTESGSVFFYPQVVKFGRENPSGMSVTPSQEEKILESRNQEEMPSEPEARESSSPSTARKKRLVFRVHLCCCNSSIFFFLMAE
ncbi:hypothetical protein FD754_003095, partial [Muntiacus muntjak]